MAKQMKQGRKTGYVSVSRFVILVFIIQNPTGESHEELHNKTI